jgi:peptidoglycan/LPS O-acetylase OafA/YrhL
LRRRAAASILLRFIPGACLGAFAAFWLALASEAADHHFGVVVLLASLSFGGLAQIPSGRARDWLERSAPYVLGCVAILVLYVVISRSFELRSERARCRTCCTEAGFPAMIYAKENRLGPRYCTCSDRDDPSNPRSDEDVCFDAGRRRSRARP